MMGVLLEVTEADVNNGWQRGRADGERAGRLTAGSALSLIRKRLRLKLSLRILDQLKALIFV